MKCDNCGKGRPRLFTAEGNFCDDACSEEHREKRRRAQERLLD